MMREAAFLDALGLGDIARARTLLDGLAKDLPRPRYLHLEALLLQRQGDHTEAMKRLDMALVLHLSDPELWAAKAKILEDMGRLDMAKRAADRACRLSPDNYEHQLLCANILYTLKDYKAAMVQVDRALELEHRSPPALVLKGVLISLLEQDHRSALTYFDSAVEMDPNNGPAWCNRGITLRQIGDRDGAIFSLQKALLINDKDMVARDSLISMGAERYIPGRPNATSQPMTTLKVGPVEEEADGEGTLPPDEWGEDDAFESLEEVGPEEDVRERPKKRRKAPSSRVREKRSIDRTECPRCGGSFKPDPDGEGRFKCPSCGLMGRLELD